MVRPYKGKKEKKEDNYDKEEIEESLYDDSTGSAKRVKTQHTASDTEAAERVVDLLAGIPVVLPIKALNLEIGKMNTPNFLRKNNQNPSEYRPDIAHQWSHDKSCHWDERNSNVTISDSRVNKAGRLKALYVKTEKVVLFEVKPHVRAMVHGKIEKDFEDYLSISDYSMSAAYCISMITNAVEHKWKIL
uniref:Uncharacterized protein n=1 Tax=Solanum lycopersicum TaxID=4081 RepID=A0A3Q7H0F5_SOLLC